MDGRKKPTIRNAEERNALVLQWLRLPGFIVKTMKAQVLRAGIDFDDAVQMGFLGLIRAAELWEPTFLKDGKPVRFSTYASAAIKRRVWKACHEAQLIHVPEYTWAKDAPEEFKEPAKHAARMHQLRGENVPFNDEERDDSQLMVGRLLALLPDRERRLVTDYYFRRMKLREIGAREGLCRERVRQIIHKGLEQMREMALAGAV